MTEALQSAHQGSLQRFSVLLVEVVDAEFDVLLLAFQQVVGNHENGVPGGVKNFV